MWSIVHYAYALSSVCLSSYVHHRLTTSTVSYPSDSWATRNVSSCDRLPFLFLTLYVRTPSGGMFLTSFIFGPTVVVAGFHVCQRVNWCVDLCFLQNFICVIFAIICRWLSVAWLSVRTPSCMHYIIPWPIMVVVRAAAASINAIERSVPERGTGRWQAAMNYLFQSLSATVCRYANIYI